MKPEDRSTGDRKTSAGSVHGRGRRLPTVNAPSLQSLASSNSLATDGCSFLTAFSDTRPSVGAAKATRPVHPSSRSPFADITANINALGRRSAGASTFFGSGREQRLSKGTRAESMGGDRIASKARSEIRFNATPKDDPRMQAATAEVSVYVDASSTPQDTQATASPPDPELSLDFPSTTSSIFPPLLNEPFDPSYVSLAQHFNDIDLTSPGAERLLRPDSMMGSMESLDSVVRYMLEKDHRDVFYSPLRKKMPKGLRDDGNLHLHIGKSAQPERPASLVGKLESTPRSVYPIHRPRRIAPTDGLARPILKGKLRIMHSELLALQQGAYGDGGKENDSPLQRKSGGIPASQEDIFNNRSMSLSDFKSCGATGSEEPFPRVLSSVRKIAPGTPYPRRSQTDSDNRPSWKC